MSDNSIIHRAAEAIRNANASLDSDAAAVLDRLLNDQRATEALAAMTADDTVALLIVRAALGCDVIFRMFNEDVAAEKAMPQRLDSLLAAVTDLGQFVRELDAGPKHPLAAHIRLEPGEADYLLLALGRIRGLIDSRRRIAAETPLRLGATGKWKTGSAAETAAIGWLAEGVDKLTGQPHYAHTATLAEITLQADDVISGDRVREALRTRRERDWRQA